MSASTIRSPSRTTRIRNTPCVLGCCGPMLTINGSVRIVMALGHSSTQVCPGRPTVTLPKELADVRPFGSGRRGPVRPDEHAVALLLLWEVRQAGVLGAVRNLEKVFAER